MNYSKIIKKLESLSNPKNIEGMARFGINSKNTLGISIPILRIIAKDIKKESTETHDLALKLWDSKIHEARILAGFIDEFDKVTEKQMDKWASQFDSWDVCDQICANLFDKTPFAYEKAKKWTSESEEFYKRAGFALIAALAWHDKEVSDKKLKEFFPYIKKHATDERNYVKKAVNWALRQIGKKRQSLTKPSINCAEEILKLYPNSKSARFIANDAIRELKKR